MKIDRRPRTWGYWWDVYCRRIFGYWIAKISLIDFKTYLYFFANGANIQLEYRPAKIVLLRPKIEFLWRRKNKETKPLSVNKLSISLKIVTKSFRNTANKIDCYSFIPSTIFIGCLLFSGIILHAVDTLVNKLKVCPHGVYGLTREKIHKYSIISCNCCGKIKQNKALDGEGFSHH